jgi:hypothetical protein
VCDGYTIQEIRLLSLRRANCDHKIPSPGVDADQEYLQVPAYELRFGKERREEDLMARQDKELGKLLRQIQGEYREMPGLCVTLPQACRLWHLDQDTCNHVLSQLVRDQFLRQTPKGLFVRT